MRRWEVGETIVYHDIWCGREAEGGCCSAHCSDGKTFILRDGVKVSIALDRETAEELVSAANVMEQDGR